MSEALNPLITELTKHSEFAANLDTKVIATVGQRWTTEISSTPRKYKPLSTLRLSAGVQIAAPHHPNERLNFWSGIRQACSNMSKQAGNKPEGVARALLIRLSRSASVRLYLEWLENYFAQYPEEPIEFIFLYQADAAVDVDERQRTILEVETKRSKINALNLPRTDEGPLGPRFASGPLASSTRQSSTGTERSRFKDGKQTTSN